MRPVQDRAGEDVRSVASDYIKVMYYVFASIIIRRQRVLPWLSLYYLILRWVKLRLNTSRNWELGLTPPKAEFQHGHTHMFSFFAACECFFLLELGSVRVG